MHVVAEGIEHPEQLALLRSIGCEFGQGYLFAPPMDGDDIEPAIVGWEAGRFAGDELRLTPSASLPHTG